MKSVQYTSSSSAAASSSSFSLQAVRPKTSQTGRETGRETEQHKVIQSNEYRQTKKHRGYAVRKKYTIKIY